VRLPAVLVALGLAAFLGCSIDPKEAAIIDDEIARLGSISSIGILPSSVGAIDSAAKAGDFLTLHRLIAPGIRSTLEIARLRSDTKALQARWKSAR
jgi:hypothetical protein